MNSVQKLKAEKEIFYISFGKTLSYKVTK
jgi:hypothetical protein